MADVIERLSTCARQLLDAGAEIEKLQDALKFYAKPEHWKQVYIASRGFSVSETLCDGGRKARAALGEEEDRK